jgi:hypothetical protein
VLENAQMMHAAHELNEPTFAHATVGTEVLIGSLAGKRQTIRSSMNLAP